jgi:myo-inositol-1(or 4)-monophosphatase
VTNLDHLLAAACGIAVEAGELIQKIQEEGFDTTSKDDLSPVTRADREADAVLKRQLSELEPGAAWLSEETADSRARLSADLLWIVDPLDGTKEFMKGLPEYSVAIALVADGQPVLGVVHNPVTGDTFSAARGSGAFRNGEPIQVREGDKLLASRSETARGEFDPFERAWSVEAVGSIEYKLALVAAGEAAVTFSRGPKHEWDVCAGSLIVREAGGRATELFGEPLRFNQSFPKVKGILAGAPGAYDEALAQIDSIGASDRMDEFKNAPS